MPVFCATVSSLPSPKIFRYQLVSNSLISSALCRCCAPCFPDEELRLTSWELLRRALVPLREATDCLRCTWWGGCPPPPTPPPLLRAASMAPEGAPLPSRAQFKEQGEEEGLQVSKCFLLLLSLTDHSSFREGCMSEVGLFWLTVRPLSLWPSAVLMLSTFACLLSPVPVCLFWALYVSLSFCLSVCVACSLVSYSLIHPETGSWFPCLVTACPGLKTGS